MRILGARWAQDPTRGEIAATGPLWQAGRCTSRDVTITEELAWDAAGA